MSEPVKIVIVLEGGMLSAVLTAGVPVEYLLIDYDTESTDEGDLVEIPQDDGGSAPAITVIDQAEARGPFVAACFEAVGG